ncbi:uncharacterized protein LOC111246590 isoform X1 [Varroa destructor]|uniref:Uncharacterized protein n=2 Tax=Varroa destructor TaxID=109461 RepID=A0A7M7JIQ8_VARDE|nr:uncharacterized protein LOC111246590 isoform X1 [Varroa destructor]XP_022652165.1 uncharacterized protein LOC111246590 isoform X1 [Varroa destructor]XP_022652166.1 uncharacterized protein LOC111246590 isoform X1 [Varroa destructor]XP_022652167.1 uncharacterized protein LOC111246590 isoform X1 [Varroa destructor]
MSSQELLALAESGDCTWSRNSDNPRHMSDQKSSSKTTYTLNKSWTSTENGSTSPMSKAAVANLLRQIKGFISSDVTVEGNESGEYWGVGEGPVVRGWGQSPRQPPEHQISTNSSTSNDSHQIQTQHASLQFITSTNNNNNNKFSTGWNNSETQTASTAARWEAMPLTQRRRTSQETNNIQVLDRTPVAAVESSSVSAGDCQPFQVGIPYKSPSKISISSSLQKNSTQTGWVYPAGGKSNRYSPTRGSVTQAPMLKQPSLPSAKIFYVGKSTVAVTSVGCENTHTKVPIWSAKFNSTIQ